MAEYLSPGVYVEEFESGAIPMEGVSTGTAGFVGLAAKGPVGGEPQVVMNFSDFLRQYGSYLSESEFGDYRFLAYAVEHFFKNGGTVAFISRVAPSDAKKAVSCDQSSLKITAKNPGAWGNEIKIIVTASISNDRFNMDVKYGDTVEIYTNFTSNPESDDYLPKQMAKSELITVETVETEDGLGGLFAEISGLMHSEAFTITLSGGTNGSLSALKAADFIGADNGPGNRTGLQSFIDNDTVNSMAMPGITDAEIQLKLVAHCEDLANRFAVLDIPVNLKTVDEVAGHRAIFDSQYAALYHPWLSAFDPLERKNVMFPPSGAVMGIYARSDNSRGVHKAPANEVVSGCVGLSCNYTKGEQDILNPIGVNLIRAFPGQGIRVWGARTTSSNAQWKYVNVCRLFIYIENSIKANISRVVFEHNDEILWSRVKRTIDGFLSGVWRTGALAGGSESEAFFVDVGKSTMSKNDIDSGRLICVIGVAPVKPAEFVVFRITQKTDSE